MESGVIFLIRHGQPEKGQLDPSLTLEGGNRVRALVPMLISLASGIEPTAVFSSPASRTQETAEILAKEFGASVVVHKALGESDMDLPLTMELIASLPDGLVILVTHQDVFVTLGIALAEVSNKQLLDRIRVEASSVDHAAGWAIILPSWHLIKIE